MAGNRRASSSKVSHPTKCKLARSQGSLSEPFHKCSGCLGGTLGRPSWDEVTALSSGALVPPTVGRRPG